MRIAILEDDPSQLELFGHWLEAAGHHTLRFERGAGLLGAIQENEFDMLILDRNLPDTTGISILGRVRQVSKVPVLFCTSRGDQDDVVKACVRARTTT